MALLSEQRNMRSSQEWRKLLTYPMIKELLREREDNYLKNMDWLDKDLKKKAKAAEAREDKYQENILWLDKDLEKKAATVIQKYARRWTILKCTPSEIWSKHICRKNWTTVINSWMLIPAGIAAERMHAERVGDAVSRCGVINVRSWHAGHGTACGGEGRRKRCLDQYEKGLQEGTCIIGHRPQQLEKKGLNTHRQYLNFKENAMEGDLIFLHCSLKGGITHFGVFTGEITDTPSPFPEDAEQGWKHTFISVWRWIPFKNVRKGAGKNATLYEVKIGDKNYTNYIPSHKAFEESFLKQMLVRINQSH